MRHNSPMSRGCTPVVFPFRVPASWCLLAALGGCGGTSSPADNARIVQPPAGSDGRVEWRGWLPCADCDGIDTQLVLQRIGQVNDYRLTETYRAADQGARFVEQGHWQRQADLVRLQGDDGSRRMFALLADGRLQSRDGHGQPLAPSEDEFLDPVSVADAP